MPGNAATTNNSGLTSWISSVRMTMVNDPGRQILEDQIQADGFSFLDDYLESIFAKPKHDHIIELVKTPARRRNVPKVNQSATSAALKDKVIVAMDLEELGYNKENEAPRMTVPSSASHKTLPQLKDASARYSGQPSGTTMTSATVSSASLTMPLAKVPCEVDRSITGTVTLNNCTVTREREWMESADVDLTSRRSINPTPRLGGTGSANEIASASVDHHALSLEPSGLEKVSELSIIEEGDEHTERSDSPVFKQPTTHPTLPRDRLVLGCDRSPKPYPKKVLPPIDVANIMDIEDVTQTVNFGLAAGNVQSFKVAPEDEPPTMNKTTEFFSERMPLEQSPKPLSSTSHDASLPADIPAEVPSAEKTEDDQVEAAKAEQPRVATYPTIGPPSPFRKSIRIPKDPSSTFTYTTSTAKQSATRTSWLVKAREAKAVEDGGKKLIPRPTLPQSSGGNKRKSSDMLESANDSAEKDEIGRTQKVTRMTEAPPMAIDAQELEKYNYGHYRDDMVPLADGAIVGDVNTTNDSTGMIDKLKKAVAGYSARAGRSMGKSLGGAAVTALAEAKAAAEAKVAERNAIEGRVIPAPLSLVSDGREKQVFTAPSGRAASQSQPALEGKISSDMDRRLNVSDLVGNPDAKKGGDTERVFKPPEQIKTELTTSTTANTRTSTTPPNSPPKSMLPIFTLPEKPKAPSSPAFFPRALTHASSRLDVQQFVSPDVAPPLSTQSTLFPMQSTYPDTIFDEGVPRWIPTQDTGFSDPTSSHQMLMNGSAHNDTEFETDMDADESWHLDEKFGETWSPVAIDICEDSVTWTTAPTRSTRGADAGALNAPEPSEPQNPSPTRDRHDAKKPGFKVPASDNPRQTSPDEDCEEEKNLEPDQDIASIRLVTPAPKSPIARERTQEDVQATSSNVGGLFSSASKLVSSVLGGSRKGKEPVKSLQLAAAAARKQQEETEKKANRLKEIEARRQQILQKKAEEDRTREEKKSKNEADRWRRAREKDDATEKRALKQPNRKVEDDLTKKRNAPDAERKVPAKQQPQRDKKDAPASKIGKLIPGSPQFGVDTSAMPLKSTKQIMGATLQSSSKSAAECDVKSAMPAKVQEKTKDADIALQKASQVAHTQMQARYQAQLDGSRKTRAPPPPSTESVELPDINSEYSDSDDENCARKLPDWAQSPELREALQSQSTVNPDHIFGAIRPLKMEELFKHRTSRFRARTSSANWAGTDALTAHEEREYARRMGYKL